MNIDYYEDGQDINDDVVMSRDKYNELIDIVNRMADKLEDTLKENEALKNQISSKKRVHIDDFLGRYKEVLDL